MSFSSTFHNAEEVAKAEGLVWANVQSFVSAYQRFFE
jgi:hypothetical protein